MRGRAHLYEGIGADRLVFGVRVLGALGIRSLVVTNAAGGINVDLPARPARPHLRPRQPAGHLGARRAERRVAGNPLPRHERRIRPGAACARPGAAGLGLHIGEGVYVAWLGPQFETPAEIRFMRASAATSWGCRRCRRSSRRATWVSASSGSRSSRTWRRAYSPEDRARGGARGRSAGRRALTALLRELVPTLSA